MNTAFARNLETLMAKEGMTQAGLAVAIGVSNQLVSKWLSGEVKAPRGDNLEAIASLFRLRRPFDIMSDGGVDYLLGESIAETHAPYTTSSQAPLYGRIAAGTPIAMIPVRDRVWCPPDVLEAHPRGFFLRVEGESMNRVLPNGSLAFVDPELNVESGQIAALNVNGCDATVKRVLFGSTSVTLVPMSYDASFRDKLYDRANPNDDTISLIGRVVWRMFPSEDL